MWAPRDCRCSPAPASAVLRPLVWAEAQWSLQGGRRGPMLIGTRTAEPGLRLPQWPREPRSGVQWRRIVCLQVGSWPACRFPWGPWSDFLPSSYKLLYNTPRSDWSSWCSVPMALEWKEKQASLKGGAPWTPLASGSRGGRSRSGGREHSAAPPHPSDGPVLAGTPLLQRRKLHFKVKATPPRCPCQRVGVTLTGTHTHPGLLFWGWFVCYCARPAETDPVSFFQGKAGCSHCPARAG